MDLQQNDAIEFINRLFETNRILTRKNEELENQNKSLLKTESETNKKYRDLAKWAEGVRSFLDDAKIYKKKKTKKITKKYLEGDCPVCMESYADLKYTNVSKCLHKFSCTHKICKPCYENMKRVAIENTGRSKVICPIGRCNQN